MDIDLTEELKVLQEAFAQLDMESRMGKGRKTLTMKSGPLMTAKLHQQPPRRHGTNAVVIARVSKHAKAKQPKGK
jgi:hypothetical protein